MGSVGESRLRQMLEHLPYFVALVDEQRRVVWVNRSPGSLEPDKVLGRLVEELAEPSFAATIVESFERAFATEQSVTYAARGHATDSGVPWYESALVVLPSTSGSPRLAMLSSVDVTHRLRSEQLLQDSEHRFHTVLEASPDTIMIVDREHRLVYLNRDPPAGSGITRGDLLGRRLEELTHASDVERARETVERALSLGEAGTYEVRGGVSGRDYVNRVMRLPGEGRGVQALITATDVTEQRRSEVKLAAVEAQLQQAQKLETVGQLAGGVAHDFNNVLLVIHGHLEFAMRGIAKGEDVTSELEVVAAAAQRATEMTRRLLTIGRRAPFRPAVFDVAGFVRETIALLDRMMPESISIELQEDLGLSVRADPVQLEQVLINLCLNARDAISGVGQIRVGVRRVAAAADGAQGPWVALAVEDTGSGMDEETLARIFEPFFTTKPHGKGTGLGLSMVHSIVTESHGRVDVQTAVGQGTTITIFLPEADKSSVYPPSFAPSERARPEGAATILLAEDEESVRKVVVRILERAGYEVLQAENGRDAVALFAQHAERIDLVMLDAVMPVLDGKGTFEELKAIQPNVRVLFSSGYSAEALSDEFLASHRLKVLAKPYRPAALLAAIRGALTDNEA